MKSGRRVSGDAEHRSAYDRITPSSSRKARQSYLYAGTTAAHASMHTKASPRVVLVRPTAAIWRRTSATLEWQQQSITLAATVPRKALPSWTLEMIAAEGCSE